MNYLQDLQNMRRLPKQEQREAASQSMYVNDVDAALHMLATSPSASTEKILELARETLRRDLFQCNSII